MEPINKGWSNKEVIAGGWKITKANFGLLWLIILISGGLSIGVNIATEMLALGNYYLNLIFGSGVSILISSIMGVGMLNVALKFVDSQPVIISDLFSKYRLWWKYLQTSLLSSFICLGGYFLFIVPGIIWSIEFSLASYFVVDEGVGPLEALKRSSLATKGMKGKLIGFQLVLLGVIILGLLALGVGLLAAIPVATLANTLVYRKLKNQTQTTETKFFSFGKILGTVIGGIIFMAYGIYIVAPQIFITPVIHSMFPKSSNPEVYAIPLPRIVNTTLSDDTDSPAHSAYGITFKTPWGEVKKTLTASDSSMLSMQFEQREVLTVRPDRSALVQTINNGSANEANRISNLLGKDATKSEYSFYTSMLNATPDRVTFTTPAQEAYATMMLSLMKEGILLAYLYKDDAKIYSFTTNGNSGYQFGTPGISKRITVHVFTKNDTRYDLIFQSSNLTQNEVDYILSSIR